MTIIFPYGNGWLSIVSTGGTRLAEGFPILGPGGAHPLGGATLHGGSVETQKSHDCAFMVRDLTGQGPKAWLGEKGRVVPSSTEPMVSTRGLTESETEIGLQRKREEHYKPHVVWLVG